MLIKKNGQSTLEYAILMVVVIAALITMQSYIRRAYQGRLKDGSDQIGEQFSTDANSMYSKNVVTSSLTYDNSLQGLASSGTVAPTTITTNKYIATGSKEDFSFAPAAP
jgi:hypothetical protein